MAWNDHSNFSLMPKWLHKQVTAQYSKMLDGIVMGAEGEFTLPMFYRFVH